MESILVQHSATGKRWHLCRADDRLAKSIGDAHRLSPLLSRILAARNVDASNAEVFLNPVLRHLPNPSGMRDADAAANLLAEAVMSGKIIGILGDYDVDGTASVSLWIHYIRAIGGKIVFHIPNRFTEGYGPSHLGLNRLLEMGAGIIVTVDCGISAADLIDQFSKTVPVVIVDHHIPPPELPRANAIVNPNRIDDDFPHKNLCAAGVSFLLLIALNRELRARGYFTSNRPEPDLKRYLDLVALATVADIVPLVGINRILVKRGLDVMAMRQNAGLCALADIGGVDGKIESWHLGFILGPRLNAAGRLHNAASGVELLTASEEWQAKAIAEQLNQWNADRQSIEESILQQAISNIESDGNVNKPVLIAANENWHSGVIGIVASRIKDRYNRPSFVVAISRGADGKMWGVGSARSVYGFHVGNAILAATQSGIIEKGGGHAMAAGFKIQAENLPALQDFLRDRFLHETHAKDLTPTLEIDAVAAISAVHAGLDRDLTALEPFGIGNPQPKFMIADAQIAHAEILKDKHVKLRLKSIDGMVLDAIAFRALDSGLGKFLMDRRGASIHLAGQIKQNHFNGRTKPQLIIDDAAVVG